MEYLLAEVDEMLELLKAHCGSRAELEISRLAAFRSKLSGIDAEPTAEVVEQLETELILLKHTSKALQFASLAAGDSELIRVCLSDLKRFDRTSAVRELSERERQDRDGMSAVLRESQDRFERAIEELQTFNT